jgi:negative regulator of replication initiation
MTNARVVDVPVDLDAAYRYLAAATRMLGDSAHDVLSHEARYTLAYDAARNAISAALRAAGRRVTAGARAHVVTFDEAQRVLGERHVDTLRQLNDVRRVRNAIEYDTREVSQIELEEIREPARAVIDAATRFVDSVAG